MIILSVFFLLFISLLLWIVNNIIRKVSTFNVSSKVHFGLLVSFIGLLLVMTVIVEFRYPSGENIHLPPKVEGSFYESPFEQEQLLNGQRPDSSKIIAIRTHDVEDELNIEGFISDEYYGVTTIIERKDGNDGIIEETIYKPKIAINTYDFSDEIDITLPKWTHNTMTIREAPYERIEFTEFSTDSLFSQFTNGISHEDHFGSFSASMSPLVIHLVVPKDLEVNDMSDSVIFMDESF